MYYWQKSSYSCFCPLEERKRVEIGVPQLRTSFVQIMAFDIRTINLFSIYFAAKWAMNEAKLKCWNGFPKFLELRQHLGCVILNEKDTVMHSYLSTHKRRWYSHRGTFRGFFDCFFMSCSLWLQAASYWVFLQSLAEDTRRPKLKALEIEQVFYQQAPYKAPDNIKTIAISKT